jgi:Mg-chelatase subunit ChlD
MRTGQGVRRVGIALALLILGGTALGQEQRVSVTPKTPAPEVRPRIELVFALDTTGSMGGLISAAKQKIWSIANTMATAEPTPQIRIGLVGYRDRGDEYVTRRTALSGDLDAVYADLMAFEAGGGGDTPESVNQALHEAVNEMSWSQDETTYRVVFLVGDCPPHMDYEDDVPYAETCALAVKRGININTIQCGGHSATTPVWKEIAGKAEGSSFRVKQDGGAVMESTPFDTKLAALSRKLDATRVWYGTREERNTARKREEVGLVIADDAPASAMAQRAAFNAGKGGRKNFLGGNELVDAYENGAVKLAEIEMEALPEELQKMSADEREAYVQEQARRRSGIQEKIKALNAKRQAYLREKIENRKDASLEEQIHATSRDQAREKGIALPARPSL